MTLGIQYTRRFHIKTLRQEMDNKRRLLKKRDLSHAFNRQVLTAHADRPQKLHIHTFKVMCLVYYHCIVLHLYFIHWHVCKKFQLSSALIYYDPVCDCIYGTKRNISDIKFMESCKQMSKLLKTRSKGCTYMQKYV